MFIAKPTPFFIEMSGIVTGGALLPHWNEKSLIIVLAMCFMATDKPEEVCTHNTQVLVSKRKNLIGKKKIISHFTVVTPALVA